jgi:predicted HTH domain antitoxin
MTLTLDLPDEILARLGAGPASVQKESLHTFVCGLYREGRISAPEAMRLLNLSSRLAFENLIAEHRAQRDWTEEEVASELETITQRNR